jgi:hypothetical protein
MVTGQSLLLLMLLQTRPFSGWWLPNDYRPVIAVVGALIVSRPALVLVDVSECQHASRCGLLVLLNVCIFTGYSLKMFISLNV